MSNSSEKVASVLQQVSEAKELSGDLTLLGFGVRGIQKMLLSSSRQAAIRGASQIVKDLAGIKFEPARAIFSAGGHGIFLVHSDHAKEVEEKMVVDLSRRLPLGEISTTSVPFDRNDQKRSLCWFRTVQETNKESAPRRIFKLPTERTACPYCNERGVEGPIAWGDDNGTPACRACGILESRDRPRTRGAREDEKRNLRLDVLEHDGKLAMISADGNRLGDCFSKCETLEEVALLSAAVSSIFENGAVSATRTLAENTLLVLAGGDDARLFVTPHDVPTFLDGFVYSFNSACEDWADAVKATSKSHPRLVGESLSGTIRNLGAGIGVVVADYKFPARRFAEFSKIMERRAKAYRPGRQSHSERFAVDIAFLTTGDELNQGAQSAQTAMSISDDDRPGVRSWRRTWGWAQALAQVPPSQTAQVLSARRDPDTFMNILGYQVARASEWRNYYQSIGLDWRDPNALKLGAPSRFLFELSRLVDRDRDQGKA